MNNFLGLLNKILTLIIIIGLIITIIIGFYSNLYLESAVLVYILGGFIYVFKALKKFDV